MGLPIQQMIFHQEQRRAMESKIEAFQYIQLHALDIDADEINLGIIRRFQDLIQSDDPHGFPPYITGIGNDDVAFKRRVLRILSYEQVRLRRMTRRATSHLKHSRTRPRGFERHVETRQGFDKDAPPAALFEKPRLGALLRIICSNFDEKAVGHAAKEFPYQFAFAGLDIHEALRYWSNPRVQRIFPELMVSRRRRRLAATRSRAAIG